MVMRGVLNPFLGWLKSSWRGWGWSLLVASRWYSSQADVVMITIKLYAIQGATAILFWFNAFIPPFVRSMLLLCLVPTSFLTYILCLGNKSLTFHVLLLLVDCEKPLPLSFPFIYSSYISVQGLFLKTILSIILIRKLKSKHGRSIFFINKNTLISCANIGCNYKASSF